MWIEYQPNPCGKRVGDCAVRAISAALDTDWRTAYLMLCNKGYEQCDLINSDSVWGNVLRDNGFIREVIGTDCPDCYTAEDFCVDHPTGVYVLGFGGHVATVIDGQLMDSWDSSQECPQFFWRK